LRVLVIQEAMLAEV